MAIPPFPPQDLAKLVLGYLVEEQLMTAYDEFLNESPYLDAQKNEYDRIIMHSLRNILAEYRAVRIYVESCKPIALRKKLFQCTNLLEVVKYLVLHVDVSKLQNDVSKERMSFEDVTTSKLVCDACRSLRIGICKCNTKRNMSSRSTNAEFTDTVESVGQATSLSDLPGNQDPHEGRHVKVLERQTIQSTSSSGVSHDALTIASPIMRNANVDQSNIPPSLPIQSNSDIISTSTAKPNISSKEGSAWPYVTESSTSTILNVTPLLIADCAALNTSLECSQNIAEFNTVLKEVYNNSAVAGNVRDIDMTENVNNMRISAAGTFRDFTTGVGGLAKANLSVPDSSTTENMILQLPPATCKENKTVAKRNCKGQQKRKCSFRIGNVKHDTEISTEVIDVDSVVEPPNPKTEEQKVTILSDIRVGNDDKLVKLPPVLQNATSTPLLQMQTIFINETPIYKPKPPEQKYTFTRDEIMAMPTIILVPATGKSQTVPPVKPQPVISQSSCNTTTACNSLSTIEPLTVDVSSSSTNGLNVKTVPSQSTQNTVGNVGLVKTVEAIKNASVPKDCIVATTCSTSTPQMQPPTRKSSSTPRRTSHVRVLDFTTPRRILNETINEDPNLEVGSNNPGEILISKSPNVSVPHGLMCVSPKAVLNIEKNTSKSGVKLNEENKSAQQKSIGRKNNNWDADLRALAVASETVDKLILPPTLKPKPKKVNKSAEEKKTTDSARKKRSVKTTPNIIRSSKKKEEQPSDKDKKKENKMLSSDSAALVCEIVSEKEMAVKQPDKVQNKSNDDDRIDTPEVERLSLQNEIGVKLNISDILETPYKQALYDIQMETPRFLGPDLPDEPMSDIKIMNIPTPRFLTANTPFTPKPAQPTPSSYASRATDYSSGGSYYKPDDQDYIPILDDINCPATSTLSKETSKPTSEIDLNLKENQPKEKSKRNKSSRPIRQCTKNVSYYKSPMVNKNHDSSKKGDFSSCSDTISANSSSENFPVDTIATPRSVKGTSSTRSGNKKNDKKSHILTKNRSPFKKSTQKSFMKIKPRRPTPTKEAGKKSRKSSENIQNAKANTRNRTTSKDNKVATDSSLVLPVATKSRRKSSTPRKLHCTKTFNSESSDHDSPEGNIKKNAEKLIQSTSVSCVHDSDTEQQPLRWSDDGSQDSKAQSKSVVPAENDNDEISQIREYIDKTIMNTQKNTEHSHKEKEGSLHIDLIKRGFDEETAKIIERDLLNTASTPSKPEVITSLHPIVDETLNNKPLERSIESDCSAVTNNLIIQEDDEEDEFSVHECNQDTTNYIHIQHDDTREPATCEISKLRDKFSMEVSIDDGVVVRLRATAFDYLIEEDPGASNNLLQDNIETEIAVSSISNMDRLYTPMKDSIRDQYYQIFDSTLTSIDTPLKPDSPAKRKESVPVNVSPENKKPEVVEITEKRKRKRSQGSTASEDSVNQYKRVKQPFTLNSKEIKDLDIETVLSRLHGP